VPQGFAAIPCTPLTASPACTPRREVLSRVEGGLARRKAWRAPGPRALSVRAAGSVMGALFVHVGQCGNQLGGELWSRVLHEASPHGSQRPSEAPLSDHELGYFLREDRSGEAAETRGTRRSPTRVGRSGAPGSAPGSVPGLQRTRFARWVPSRRPLAAPPLPPSRLPRRARPPGRDDRPHGTAPPPRPQVSGTRGPSWWTRSRRWCRGCGKTRCCPGCRG